MPPRHDYKAARRVHLGTYLGTWDLPSGNAGDAYFHADPSRGLTVSWDREPSPDWPREDVAYWHAVAFPELLAVLADLTGKRILGVRSLTPDVPRVLARPGEPPQDLA